MIEAERIEIDTKTGGARLGHRAAVGASETEGEQKRMDGETQRLKRNLFELM